MVTESKAQNSQINSTPGLEINQDKNSEIVHDKSSEINQDKIEDSNRKNSIGLQVFQDKTELSKRFIRVGDEYMKEVFTPDKDGKLHRNYVKRDKGTVQDDLGKNTDFFKSIKKYEGFCLVPSHTNYQQVVQGFFNEYYKITHQQKSGNFESILDFLKHLFGDKIEFILDYIQILYTKPTQRLPIILIESKERGTGKSTFGDLLKLIFEDNSAKLGNAELSSDFNAIWVKRLVVIVDETSLEKKEIMQMLKRFSTETGKITSNEKNKAQKQIDFFGKFIFLSNEEGKALPIEKGETRFAVFKAPTFEEKGIKENPNIQSDFVSEIPAFLHFLTNRKLKFKEVGRMYFSLQDYHTDQLQHYFDNNLTPTGIAIRDLVIDSFNYFDEAKELKFSISNLCSELQDRLKYLDRSKVKNSLIEEFKLIEQKKNRFSFYSFKSAEKSVDGQYFSSNENNSHYIFKRELFVEL